MAYDFKTFDDRGSEIVDWFSKELATIRTGRANPAILDGIQVDSYGAKVPVNQVGSVGVEDPRTLRVSVWDAGQVNAVERAIMDSDLGVSVSSDESGVRVSFPELNGERREQLLKLAKSKLEEARVSLRNTRDEAVKKIDAEELSMDDSFRTKDDLQKKVDEKNKILGEMLDKKESEISN